MHKQPSMKKRNLMLLLICSCSAPPIPDRRIPSGTLMLRESFQGPGPERMGSWWGRFDTEGCWWEAHNTWMVVTDPVLKDTSAHPAHWNAVEPDKPWFCLEQRELQRLETLMAELPTGNSGYGYVRPLDRWTVVIGGEAKSHVVYRGMPKGSWRPLIDFFAELAAMSVWGNSPE
jgi:hypothetical protein